MIIWKVIIGHNVEIFRLIADDYIEAGRKARNEWVRLCKESGVAASEIEREVSSVERLFEIDVE